jgi:hypothetical protein
MTEGKIIEVLNEYNHRGFSDWETRIAKTVEDLSDGKLLLQEAYAVVKELLKVEKMREMVESYLKRHKKVIIQSEQKYVRIVADREKRKAYVWQERNETGDIIPVATGLAFSDVYMKIIEMVGLFFHFTYDDKGILVREYND